MIAWLTALLVSLHLVAAPPPSRSPAAPAEVQYSNVPPDLARIAGAVEGVESGHGTDPKMWKPTLSGPQGPMQVSAAAALDVGVGNRFDADQNRTIGRTYLAGLHRRYGNWTDAVAAYYWGPANLDRWIEAGRPLNGISDGVRTYLNRVVHELAAVPAPVRAVPPAVPPGPQPADIKDPALRMKVVRNIAAIEQLQGFLDEMENAAALVDRDEARVVQAAIRTISARPGYEEFAAATTGPRSASRGLEEIITVLIDKLNRENAAIQLIDQYRRRPGRK
jgi:hypothetical protein